MDSSIQFSGNTIIFGADILDGGMGNDELYGDVEWGSSREGEEGQRLMKVAREKLEGLKVQSTQEEKSPQSADEEDAMSSD